MHRSAADEPPVCDARSGGVVEEFDYVIVGAGSAGCVVAARLSEDPSVSVLLEAGPEARNPAMPDPGRVRHAVRVTHSIWAGRTEPQGAISRHRVFWPRGRVIGGSSSINAMMWIRGFRTDYDAWAELAGSSWRFDAVLEYFRRIEAADAAISGDAYGRNGPLAVAPQRDPNELTSSWLAAAIRN